MDVSSIAQVSPAFIKDVSAVSPVAPVGNRLAGQVQVGVSDAKKDPTAPQTTAPAVAAPPAVTIGSGSQPQHASISGRGGLYVARAPGPPPVTVISHDPTAALGKLEMIVDVFI